MFKSLGWIDKCVAELGLDLLCWETKECLDQIKETQEKVQIPAYIITHEEEPSSL